jgi:hypothetical protein
MHESCMSMGIRLFIGLESCRLEGIEQWKGTASGLLELSLSTAVRLGGPSRRAASKVIEHNMLSLIAAILEKRLPLSLRIDEKGGRLNCYWSRESALLSLQEPIQRPHWQRADGSGPVTAQNRPESLSGQAQSIRSSHFNLIRLDDLDLPSFH